MKIELDPKKDINANAAIYYERAKAARAKLAGIESAHRRLLLEREGLSRQSAAAIASADEVKIKRVANREWFEKFKWFKTSGGRLCVAGKDAKQNDALYAKHMSDVDLFFHADIQGAAFTLLADGVAASDAEKLECAQWAACHSSAWKRGFSTVDVYGARKGQLSKASHGEYVGKGAFMVKGAREWFRNTELKVIVGVDGGGNISVVPKLLPVAFQTLVEISPGEKKRNADRAAKALGLAGNDALETLMQLLP